MTYCRYFIISQFKVFKSNQISVWCFMPIMISPHARAYMFLFKFEKIEKEWEHA